MARELDESQALAVKNLRPGSILCGGVGSGKSRTALAYYYSEICGGGLEVFNGKFTYPKRKVDLYIITTPMKRDKLEWEEELLLFRLSTDSSLNKNGVNIKVDSWNNIKKYTDIKNAFFIFDEQRVVGSGAWVKAFLKIAKSNKWILLSATPGDNWIDYIPIFIANGYYKNRTEFITRHVVYKPYRNFPVVDHYENVGRLQAIRKELLVNIAYEQKSKKDVRQVPCNFDKDKYGIVLRQRKDPETLLPIKNISEFSYKIKKVIFSSSNRIEKAYNVISSIPRVIVFYNYDYELEILRDICKRLKVNYGERNGHKHDPIPDTKEWVYLVQYTSGCEGWNCIDTNYILFYSPSPSYKQMAQSAGRIDRRTTSFKTLNYLYLKSNSDIERRIWNSLENKKNFNDSALSDIWEGL